MKITNFNFNSAQSNLKVFKPIQYLNIVAKSQSPVTDPRETKLRVRVVDSMTGRVDEIIPSINLDVLGEICSMNEGFYMFDMNHYSINIMLHPTSAIYLSNDKYLEIDLTADTYMDGTNVTIYGLESPVIDKDFVCRYNKFYMAAGELQKTFVVGENENLIIPSASFDEIVLQYKNGSSCCYTKDEVVSLMMLKNDIVCVSDKVFHGSVGSATQQLILGCSSLVGLDIADVDNFTIKRTASTEAMEVIMIDTIKE